MISPAEKKSVKSFTSVLVKAFSLLFDPISQLFFEMQHPRSVLESKKLNLPLVLNNK